MEIPLLEELKDIGGNRLYLSKICPYLEYREGGIWYCKKFKEKFYRLVGKEIYKGKRDCAFKEDCESGGNKLKVIRDEINK